MQISIASWWSAKAVFEAEIPDNTEEGLRLRVALEVAVKARADLAGAYLASADLTRANLAGADLDGATLTRANLARANLAGADLTGADLAGATLARAYLTGADLAGATLTGAYLAGANLAGANLARANLAGADLDGTNLAGTNLDGANLASANLDGAAIARANLGNDQIATIPPVFVLGTRYEVMITDRHIRIGCEVHTTVEWDKFDEGHIRRMDGSAAWTWWQHWRDAILSTARAHQIAGA